MNSEKSNLVMSTFGPQQTEKKQKIANKLPERRKLSIGDAIMP